MVFAPSILTRVPEFLSYCRKSSSNTFQAFSQLLTQLKEPETRIQARQFLGLVAQVWQAKSTHKQYPFSFVNQTVKNYNGGRRNLKLLLFSSVFSPEEWSFTFYEGLLRYPAEEFYDRRVVELGCGSGWITLAIALNSLPKVIFGVDINPRAVICSQLNLYLNALDDEGNPIYDSEKKTLLERVQFAESNLLEHFANYPKPLDRIVGCIPQVLHPELSVMQDLVDQGTNDEFLHSLSNYCEKQGYVEDQFGLGLLAKAIEQSIELLRPTGKVIFNFGGRPGGSVLERLMTRRGLKIRRLWQTRVEQDPDTDIASLVAIEAATGHRFEFFMTPRGDAPISATTAQIYSQKGGQIYHSVSVYEGVLDHPSWLKQIFRVLKNPELQGVKNALDLTGNDADVAEERFYWLASLFHYLEHAVHFPYGATAGEIGLREHVVSYFRNYHGINWQTNHLLIAPSRTEVIANLLTIYNPELVMVDKRFRHLLPHSWRSPKQLEQQRLIESPSRTPLVCQLITKLRPQIIITGLQDFEITAADPFELLVNTAQQVGALLVIDISPNLNLSSNPKTNGLFEYLARKRLPNNVILLADLIKNRLYPDLSLCISVATNSELRTNLVNSAELTYSRVSLITQFFYQQLLEQLLHFQTTRLQIVRQSAPDPMTANVALSLKPANSVAEAFVHPAILENTLPFTPVTIRLDCGENCLPAPNTLKKAIAESFACQEITQDKTQVHRPLGKLLRQRYGIEFSDRANFAFGSGVSAIFSAIIQQCAHQSGTFLFPQGAYGYFRAAFDFHKVPIKIINGEPTTGFKLSLAKLEEALATTKNPWLYLNAPIANPTGALYSASELQELIKLAWKYSATVILDTIFAGLEFGSDPTKFDLSWLQERRQRSKGKIILLGGISKEFAAAGIRFGYAYAPQSKLIKQLKDFISCSLPQTTSYAMSHLFQSFTDREDQRQFSPILQEQQSQREKLQQRAKQLTLVLEESGWQVIKPQGGLFLVAKPVAFLGKTITYDLAGNEQKTVIDGDSITQALFGTVGLTINSATWTGLPDYCRFVLSVNESEFQAATIRIRRFQQLVLEQQ